MKARLLTVLFASLCLLLLSLITGIRTSASIDPTPTRTTGTLEPGAWITWSDGTIFFCAYPCRFTISDKLPTLAITPTNLPEPTKALTPMPDCVASAIVIANALNVRGGPGQQYPIVGSVKLNQTVKLKVIGDGFSQLCDGSGWVSNTYLKITQ